MCLLFYHENEYLVLVRMKDEKIYEKHEHIII